MHIGFDAKRAFNNHTGLGNYSRFILDALVTYYPDHQYSLYTPRVNSEYQGLYQEHDNVQLKFPQGSFYNRFHSLWRSFGLAKALERDEVSIYHGLSNELPARIHKADVKSVVTIHDLIFIRFPQFYEKSDRIIYQKKSNAACKNADKVIAISQQTKRDIERFLDVDASKIEVIYQDCHPRFHQQASEQVKQEVREKYQLSYPFVLSVGTLESRKNQLTLLHAFSQLKEFKDLHLVLVGKTTPYADKLYSFVKKQNLSNRVHFLSNVQHTELPAIYQMADLFVYPSLFEGFGIPILEALHSNIPVVTSRGSCFSEAGGGAVLYTDADDPAEMAQNMRELLSNPETRDKLNQKRTEQLEKFTSKRVGEQLMELYTGL